MMVEDLKREYWEAVRRTRHSSRISPVLVSRVEDQWKGFDGDVVEQALRIHLSGHGKERECYTLGIMRNLQRQKNERSSRDAESRDHTERAGGGEVCGFHNGPGKGGYGTF
ncbi:MAG: hypothetical protein NC305_13430 [Lachnospiraceae bacterium]|nr:hypothetical protein [Butyrivibrio sp.]MCM1344000.1 hypothetical protein [Muribaculaceae bacterium]MCM1411533.1 hypothetical protein [Lachnospiraceae bacterium]